MNTEVNQSQTVETIETEQTMEATKTIQPAETALATELVHLTSAAQLAELNRAIIEEKLQKEAESPKPFGVPKNSVRLYTNAWEYSLYVFKLECGATQKVSFTVVDPDGKPRGAFLTTRSRLFGTGKDRYKFVQDFVGDFDQSDITEIQARLGKVWERLKPIRSDDRVPFDVIYAELSETEEKADIVTKTHTKDGNYINIDVGEFKQIVEKEDWGWKPLEVKRQLRDLGLLRVNKDRPFDYTVVDSSGTPCRTISIKLGMNGEAVDKQ